MDTTGHAHAVAVAAATLNALRYRAVPTGTARVIRAGADRGGDLPGLLLAVGVRSLTLHEVGAPPVDPAGPADLLVDLTGVPAPEDGTPVLRACPQELPRSRRPPAARTHSTLLRPCSPPPHTPGGSPTTTS
ncbi:hypothetical protein OOK29_42515 [Streptomyces phaeochromogenes]|uniref:hypothetical protein n=1 Tax=Streptomyces TaxID=1883 RepID=UPI0022580F65|nr:hypothetical protein [Streptomyces phaeochromogenes]MCX5604821.1 hypothetical protein [Streptomyces phaeochromogenes]